MTTAPDLSGYNQLTLYDGDASSLVQRALLDRATKDPDWQPQDGNTEMTLMESLATIVDELRFAINRVPDGTAEVLIRLFGITRDPGSAPLGTVTVTLTDSNGHDIPAGLQLDLPVAGGGTVRFMTATAITVPSGSISTTLDVTATTTTSAANGTAVGTPLQVASAVPFIDTVQLASLFAGSDPEDSVHWLNRATAQFQRLSQTLVLPVQFTAAALEDANVFRATTIDNFDGTAAAAGHVSVAVLGQGAGFLSSDEKTALVGTLSAQALGNLVVHVIDPTVTTVNIQASVKAIPPWDVDIVQTNVVAALHDYLSTDTWPWSATVRRNQLLSVMSHVDGVDYVASLTSPTADIALPGAAPLAKLGSASISVS